LISPICFRSCPDYPMATLCRRRGTAAARSQSPGKIPLIDLSGIETFFHIAK